MAELPEDRMESEDSGMVREEAGEVMMATPQNTVCLQWKGIQVHPDHSGI